ncbi:DUF1893 domain-containing protein [Chloroflexota bacterium]
MYADLFNKFLVSGDTLRVYKDKELLFSSSKDRLLPLLEYIDRITPHHQQVVILDKIVGNAAALLAVKAGCQEIYSPLGSQFAIKTLEKYGIKCHLTKTVPHIQKPDGQDMCPMEKLSLDKGPEEFYQVMRNITK